MATLHGSTRKHLHCSGYARDSGQRRAMPKPDKAKGKIEANSPGPYKVGQTVHATSIAGGGGDDGHYWTVVAAGSSHIAGRVPDGLRVGSHHLKLARVNAAAQAGVWFGGIVSVGHVFSDWDTVKLERPDGYKVDLLFRFQEWVDSHGKKVVVRYWITDKPMSKNRAQEGFLRTQLGMAVTDMEARHYTYGEYTSGVEYVAELRVGGHDLMRELFGHQGKHVWLHLSSPMRCKKK